MNQQICDWLGLPTGNWPPDHYTLLGLKPNESDPHVIEERVQERMQRVRPFQLNYPEQVTEAMNRLAQAFSCLTDPTARKAYEESFRTSPQSSLAPLPLEENGSIDPNAPLAWLFGPWDRLADEESRQLLTLPKFREWTASVKPPRQRRKLGSREVKDGESIPSLKKILKNESREQKPPPSLFWRHSNTFLLLLAILALLLAVWRQLGR
jgi:hypothetical protein